MGLHSSIAQREAALGRWRRSGLSLREFAEQEDIPRSTFYCWKKKYLKKEVQVTKHSKRDAWPPEQKFAIVLQTSTMSEVELSAYCRENGLFPEQVTAWKEDCIQGISKPNQSSGSVTSSKEDKKKIKRLERELNRKEKALAETAALLVLRKKYNALWSEGEDD